MGNLPAFLQLSPGLVFWTLINFTIFALIIAKFAWKPMMSALASRTHTIDEALRNAETANAEAKAILTESKEKIANAQNEMMSIVREGKLQAEAIVRKAAEEAEVVKKQKVYDATREIERQRDLALQQLRSEVSTMVVDATSKMLGRSINDADHKRIAEDYVNELSKN